MHNIQSKKRANASLLYGNRSGLIFSPSSERPQCSVKRGDCLSEASSSPFSETKEESRRKNTALILSFGIFSFVSRRKKKNQKERIKAAFFRLLRCFLRLKGRNSLRSNSLPFLTLRYGRSLDGEKSRPGNHAGCRSL